jgi:O-antigen/teichoic acid export membrane protein
VLDQALFAISNLVVNILLARQVSALEYGAFVTAYAVLLLIGVVHTALLIDPMLVFGTGRYRRSFSHYVAVLQRYHWRASLVAALAFGVCSVAFGAWGFQMASHATGGLALAVPGILLSWLARRACYAASHPKWAALSGVANFVCATAGVFVLARMGGLSVLSVLLLLGVVGLASAACMLVPLGRLTDVPLRPGERAQVWAAHRAYGRWLCATGLLNWGCGYIFYLALPLWSGLAASGVLRAAMNLIMPILQSDSALLALLTPHLVRSRQAGRFASSVTLAAIGFALEALAYGVGLVLIGPQLVHWVYGGTYELSMTAIVVLAAIPLLNSHMQVLGAALRAEEQTRAVFSAALGSLVVIATIGLAAVVRFGVQGALLATLLGCLAQIVVMGWVLSMREKSGVGSAQPGVAA